MSECQVRLSFLFLPSLISSLQYISSCVLFFFVFFLCQAVPLFLSVYITLWVCVSLSVSAFVSLSEWVFWRWHRLPWFWRLPPGTECVRACDCVWLHCCRSWRFTGIPLTCLTDQPCEWLFEGYFREVGPTRCSLSSFIWHVALKSTSEQKLNAHMARLFHQLEAVALRFRWTANRSAVEWMALTVALWELEKCLGPLIQDLP